jgi:hypothetical protein
MSFGTNNTTKTAENNLGGISNQATNQLFPAVTSAGSGLLNSGANNVTAGTNYYNTLLNGNQANTGALLQPNINQMRQNSQNTLGALSTLMPRGGGRAGSLFAQSLAPESGITDLFNSGRTAGASALPQIGLQQQGLGSGLYGIGNSALGTASGANSQMGNIGLQAQQMNNQLWGSIGSGIMGLATMPFGGGTASNGLMGLFGKGG